jgi:hypothetical protein
MPVYTVQNTETKKNITFEWNDANPPTDADMEEIFQTANAQVQPEQTLLQKASPYVRPVLEMGGMVGGGILGAAAGPAGTIAGGAGGYAIGKESANLYDEAVGLRKPENLLTERGALNKVAETGQSFVEGAEMEAGGLAINKGIGVVAKSPIAKKAFRTVFPKPTSQEALGQVLQGKTKDMVKGEKALGAIDTKDVKTYKDLSKKIEEAIPDYSKKVDAELLKDTNIYKMDDLITVEKTKGGETVTSNYVQDALENLKELYVKTKDLVKAGNIEELLAKAETQGLTKKEVNDIARIYGSEYKAFSPSTGEPLTSVNKQAYENTRKGLKEVSRRGLDDTAKELDATLSGLLNTKRLIDKNVEAANRLRQKIDERGLGEKIGRGVLTALDYATLGTVKGAVLKTLPRGLGYKVKNYMDLEESLARNLKIINTELSRINRIESAPPVKTRMDMLNAQLKKL